MVILYYGDMVMEMVIWYYGDGDMVMEMGIWYYGDGDMV